MPIGSSLEEEPDGSEAERAKFDKTSWSTIVASEGKFLVEWNAERPDPALLQADGRLRVRHLRPFIDEIDAPNDSLKSRLSRLLQEPRLANTIVFLTSATQDPAFVNAVFPSIPT
jgi:hypothetical protein